MYFGFAFALIACLCGCFCVGLGVATWCCLLLVVGFGVCDLPACSRF